MVFAVGSAKMPQVSIGIPVYNGERYLAEAIDSVLAQTFEDFELIISDNASTDRTAEICQAYAEKDARVRYYRNETNLGISRNFSRIVELSSGKYFKYIAHDDGIEPDFLERCVPVLDGDPTVVLVCSKYININERKKTSWNLDYEHSLMSPHAHERFRKLLSCKEAQVLPVFGLIRLDVLRQTHLIRPFVGTDFCLLVELALKGKFAQVPEYLIRSRDHTANYTNMKARSDGKQGHAETLALDPESKARVFMPHWHRLKEYFLSVVRSQEKPGAKLRMIAFLVYPLSFKWIRWLGSEVLFAIGVGPYYVRVKRSIVRYFQWLIRSLGKAFA
jgi:glycosyltransferase involved in cell wall biosynthesis